MIPAMELSGVLPPYTSEEGPHVVSGRSPYAVTPLELVARFSGSAERRTLLRGLFAYRARLRAAGVISGFQWLDGSFLEDCEGTRGRAPKDIDLVTFARRPAGTEMFEDWQAFVQQHVELFHDLDVDLGLDAYYVDLHVPPEHLVATTAYWFGLFSHQRGTHLWKGMLQLDLAADDGAAIEMLGDGP